MLGCINMTACNTDPAASTDDGSCVYAVRGEDCFGSVLQIVDGATYFINNPSGPQPLSQAGEHAVVSVPADYIIGFEITPDADVVASWGSILHLTATGSNCCNYGDRIPAVWFHPGSHRLHIRDGHGSDGNAGCDPPDELAVGVVTIVRIEMRPLSVNVYYGDELKCTQSRGDRQVFADVVVYASDPWHTPARASIDRFYLQELTPELNCTFSTGDGTGGTEVRVGTAASAQACATLVHQMEPSANGATYSSGPSMTASAECYAEFGMTGDNDSASWQSCMWMEHLPVTNVVTHSTLCSNGNGAGYAPVELTVGTVMYCDRDYTFAVLPAFLVGTTMVQTANSDKNSDATDTAFLCFDVAQESTIYLLYDSRVTDGLEPSWMTSMMVGQHTDVAEVTDTGMELMEVWIYYTSGAETVCLGGNAAPGIGSNYLVAVGPAIAHTVIGDATLAVCTFTIGDGTGGTEVRVGSSTSAQACATLVQQTEPSANGATYSNSGGAECYAEFGMTGENDSTSWQSCMW